VVPCGDSSAPLNCTVCLLPSLTSLSLMHHAATRPTTSSN